MRKGRRRGVVAAALLLAVALLLLTGYRYHEARTPEYALGEAAKALKARDYQAFSTYVDVDSVTEHGYDEGAKALAAHVSELRMRYPDDPFFWHDQDFMQCYADAHRTRGLALAHGILEHFFAGQESDDFAKDPMGYLAREAERMGRQTHAEIRSIDEKGDEAKAVLHFRGTGEPYGKLTDGIEVGLLLRRQVDGVWKIERVENAEALVLPVADSAEAFWALQGWN